MTFPQAHYYVTFGGNQCTNAEIWQTGFRQCPTDSAPTAAELLANLDAISVTDILEDAGDFITMKPASGYSSPFPGATSVSWAKVAVIGTDGHYVGDPKVASGAKRTGTGGSGCVPPQLAPVVSFWSGSNFGRANHGRMYCPLPSDWLGNLVATTGAVTQVYANALRDSVKSLMAAIAGEIYTVAVPSGPHIMSSRGLGDKKPILQIGCGPVMDTQRRRRSALVDVPIYVAR